MKNYINLVLLLASAGAVNNVNARCPMRSMFEDMHERQIELMRMMDEAWDSWDLMDSEDMLMLHDRETERQSKVSKEDKERAQKTRDDVRKTREIMDKIVPQVSSDTKAGTVTVTFPIAGIDKSGIKLDLIDGILSGSIHVTHGDAHGTISFDITDKALRLYSGLEARTENVKKTDDKKAEDKKSENCKSISFNQINYRGVMRQIALPAAVDVETNKVVTKGDSLIITLVAKRASNVHIEHLS